jgi:molybdate transport system ATP-binding protein
MGMSMLTAEFSKQLGAFEVDAAFTAESGKTLVLVGESGAGKTTILNLLAGLMHPDRGHIQLGEENLFDSEQGRVLPAHDRSIAYVFQDYSLFPHLSVYENVAFGLRAQRSKDSEVRQRVNKILEQFSIAELAHQRPQRLSGGQQQRVALARALVIKPDLLLLDEPLSALDAQTRRGVRSELRRTLSQLPCVTVYVTHSPFEAMVFGDHVGVVGHGKIVQLGSGDELLRQPRSRYVAALMGVNLFQGYVINRDADGLAEVQTRDGIVHALSEDVQDETFIAVDPKEITLHTLRPAGTAQNIFEGRILEILPEPPLGERVRVVLDTRPALVAEVTAHAVRDLNLREGLQVFASFKATAAKSYN